MSRAKTEVMWVGHQREDLNISLDGKEINQVDGLCTLEEWLMRMGIQR